ncbi:potassium transporter KtrA [Mycoplasmopsis pullorum]|uniref:potassium channel family protein n=1 Tax=Mycoplasmopsis pullorum TaxID=48003 RepID=UPI001118CD7D|nr:potassium transporter KtrA [Mycoplasmopsis pullorum]TNK83277.1 potassium transporter KtrA [Mycoplasmopsis pullorum]TNK84980.1 potassium transporter KtrA [Mycoplasmopsis pullorum]TNK85573.1 potassium transporter KtrA [Mycoplasmopsis pullorum]TNK86068.1 potassium transporter KtrA [Mycoplasmopsis pullorum]
MNLKHKEDICVIGTGRFGQAIIGQLLKMNKSVFVIDKIEENVKMYANEVERAVVADAADMKALEALKIYQMETVVVAVPDNIEIVAALLELGIKNIIARATSKRHARVLKQIGVNVIIRPESESGIRTALIAANDNFIKYSQNLLELGDNFVVGTTIIKNVELDGKMIRELALNNKGVTIILIKRNEKSMRAQGDTKIFLDDLVSLVGKVEDVTNVLGLFNEC